MAELAQVVAAVAAGSLLTVATMLVFKLHKVQHGTGRERRIDEASAAVIAGVETFRQQARAAPQSGGASMAPDGVVEIRSKAHLTMLVERDADAAPDSPVSCELRKHPRAARGRQAQESRP